MLPEEIQGHLVDALLNKHPLPWRVEQDWTWEILDANNNCILKCMTASAAEGLVEVAAKRDADNRAGKAEALQWLRMQGVDIDDDDT